MLLKDFFEISFFVLAVAGFIFNILRTNQIKSNCIATLTAKVDELDRKMTAMWSKHDALDNKIDGVILDFARIDQKLKDKLNGAH